MNEFIVWDKDNYYGQDNPFYELNEFLEDGLYVSFLNIEIFPYIGKKDINNKKIYANCSIVKFEYLDKKLKGYFKFDNEALRYFIVLLSGGVLLYEAGLVFNLKIIDTIQENKLGLI